MRPGSKVAVAILLLPLWGCLEGDPNPLANTTSGSSGSSATSSGNTATPTPIDPGGQCSRASQVAIDLTFRNNSADRTVNLFWVDFACRESRFATINPGESHIQHTFTLHPWRLRDAGTNALYKEFVGTSATASVIDFP
jgi:hypothetical protein